MNRRQTLTTAADLNTRWVKEVVMDFSYVLGALKGGLKVARKGWNGKNMWLKVQRPDEHSNMTLPYIYIEYPVGHPAYPKGCRCPWLASQTDLMAEDWLALI